MNTLQIIKAFFVWVLIAFFAVINGVIRENLLAHTMSNKNALAVSGITLSIVILLVTFFTFGLFKVKSRFETFLIGIQWAITTLLFEFFFGYFVLNKTVSEIFLVFDIFEGNLFILVLMTCLTSPFLIFMVREKYNKKTG